MARVSTMMRDHKLSKDHRDKILGVSISSVGVSVSSVGHLVPSVNGNDANDLRIEDLWEEEARSGVEDEENQKKDGRGKDFGEGKPKLMIPKVTGGNRRWVMRDKDSFADTDVVRGLSLLSQLDRQLGVRLEQDAKFVPLATASRRIPLSQLNQTDDADLQIRQQSAPVDVPDWSKILGNHKQNGDSFLKHTSAEDDDDEDEEKLPPHELLAREYAKSQHTRFSVFEGVGRTLKGRDLSRVRNAVLQRTGFLDS